MQPVENPRSFDLQGLHEGQSLWIFIYMNKHRVLFIAFMHKVSKALICKDLNDDVKSGHLCRKVNFSRKPSLTFEMSIYSLKVGRGWKGLFCGSGRHLSINGY